MATYRRRRADVALLALLSCVVMLIATGLVAAVAPSSMAPPQSHATSSPSTAVVGGACEMVLDGPTCQRRCECEWCPPPGPDQGCHAINLEGPCGGRAGQRAPHDACYDDSAAGLEGLAVGALFGGLAIAAVILWCCWRRIRSLQRGPDYERLAVNGDDHALPDEVPAKDAVVDVEPGPTRAASRPIDMPRPRARPLHT